MWKLFLSFSSFPVFFGLSVGPTLNKYDHFSKHMTIGAMSIGGRLQEREIEYIAQAGFASILSIAEFNTTDTTYKNVTGSWPSSQDEKEIAKSYSMEMEYFSSSLTVESVNLASKFIMSLPKPLYVHCHVGWTASLFTQLHLIKSGALAATDIYNHSLTLGYDYQSNADAVALIEAYTGVHAIVVPEQIEQTLSSGEMSYKNYYWSHRVGNDYWYNIGQVLDTHVTAIQMAGYGVVISFRADGEATTRLPSDPPTGAVANHEFSDSQGNYDVQAENVAFSSAGISFFNLPVSGSMSYSADLFAKYKSTLDEISKMKVPVLAHCASGFRSAAYIVAYISSVSSQCTHWALKEATRIGYHFDADSGASDEVVEFFESVLKC